MFDMLTMVILLIVFVALLMVVLLLKSKEKKELRSKQMSYHTFYIVGIFLIILGVLFTMFVHSGFLGVAGFGVLYTIIGLLKRKKWKN